MLRVPLGTHDGGHAIGDGAERGEVLAGRLHEVRHAALLQHQELLQVFLCACGGSVCCRCEELKN